MWPFKRKPKVTPLYPNPEPCNIRHVSYTWGGPDKRSGFGSITMMSNPGVKNDQITKRDLDEIVSLIKEGVSKEQGFLGAKIIITAISYLGYMTESEYYR